MALPAEKVELAPVVVSSNRYLDIRPYCRALYRGEQKHVWTGVMPWEFPQNASRDAEENFLREYFSEEEIHTQGGAAEPGNGFRFLKQVWYSCALWNWEQRIPAIANWWIDGNKSTFTDPGMTEWLLCDDVVPTTFFTDADVAMYGEKCICAAIGYIQNRIKEYCANLGQKDGLAREPPVFVPEVAKGDAQQDDQSLEQRSSPDHAAAHRGVSPHGRDTELVSTAESHVHPPRETHDISTDSTTSTSLPPIHEATQNKKQLSTVTTTKVVETSSNGRHNYESPRNSNNTGTTVLADHTPTRRVPHPHPSHATPHAFSHNVNPSNRHSHTTKPSPQNRYPESNTSVRSHGQAGYDIRGGRARGSGRNTRGRHEVSHSGHFGNDWRSKHEDQTMSSNAQFIAYNGQHGHAPWQSRPLEEIHPYFGTPDFGPDYSRSGVSGPRNASHVNPQSRPLPSNQSNKGTYRHMSQPAKESASQLPLNHFNRWSIGREATHVTTVILYGVAHALSEKDVFHYFAAFSNVTRVMYTSDGLYDSRNYLVEFADHWGVIAALERRDQFWAGGVIHVEVAPMYLEPAASAFATFFDPNSHDMPFGRAAQHDQGLMNRRHPTASPYHERYEASSVSRLHPELNPQAPLIPTPAAEFKDDIKKIRKSANKSKKKIAYKQSHDSPSPNSEGMKPTESQGTILKQPDVDNKPEKSVAENVAAKSTVNVASADKLELFRTDKETKKKTPEQTKLAVESNVDRGPGLAAESLTMKESTLPTGAATNTGTKSANVDADCSQDSHGVRVVTNPFASCDTAEQGAGEHVSGTIKPDAPTNLQILVSGLNTMPPSTGTDTASDSAIVLEHPRAILPSSGKSQQTSKPDIQQEIEVKPAPHESSPLHERVPAAHPTSLASTTDKKAHEEPGGESKADPVPTIHHVEHDAGKADVPEAREKKDAEVYVQLENSGASQKPTATEGQPSEAATVLHQNVTTADASEVVISDKLTQGNKKAKGPAQTESLSMFAKKPKSNNKKKSKAAKRKSAEFQPQSLIQTKTSQSRDLDSRLLGVVNTADKSPPGYMRNAAKTKVGDNSHDHGSRDRPRRENLGASIDRHLERTDRSIHNGPLTFAKIPESANDTPQISVGEGRDVTSTQKTDAPTPELDTSSFQLPDGLQSGNASNEDFSDDETSTTLSGDEIKYTPPASSPEVSTTSSNPAETKVIPPRGLPKANSTGSNLGSKVRALQRRAQQNNLVLPNAVRRNKLKRASYRGSVSSTTTQGKEGDEVQLSNLIANKDTTIILISPEESRDKVAEAISGDEDDAEVESDGGQDSDIEKFVTALRKLKKQG